MVGLIRYTRLTDMDVVRLEAHAIDYKRKTITVPEPNRWVEQLPDEPACWPYSSHGTECG